MSVAMTFASLGGVITDVVVGPATHSSIGGRGKGAPGDTVCDAGCNSWSPVAEKTRVECKASESAEATQAVELVHQASPLELGEIPDP